MKLASLLTASCLLAYSSTAASAQTRLPAPSVGRLAAEVVVGTAAIPLGFVAGGLLARRLARAFGASEAAASATARTGGGAGAALAAAAGVSAIGSRGPATGSFLASLGGAVGGGLVSYTLVRINRRPADAGETWRCGTACRVSALAIALLPATGATIAFNASRRREQAELGSPLPWRYSMTFTP